jgi:hypothetical protein
MAGVYFVFMKFSWYKNARNEVEKEKYLESIFGKKM